MSIATWRQRRKELNGMLKDFQYHGEKWRHGYTVTMEVYDVAKEESWVVAWVMV